jgi:protein required for attachment to host cells
MILPTGPTVAVADSETVHLFRNTGVKLGMHLVEITATPPAPAHAGSGSRHHTGCAYPVAGGSLRTTSRQRRSRS